MVRSFQVLMLGLGLALWVALPAHAIMARIDLGGMGTSDYIAMQIEAEQAAARVRFWWMESVVAILFLGFAWLLGHQVQRRGWRVGYTRKTLALALWFVPVAAAVVTRDALGRAPYSMIESVALSTAVFVMCLLAMAGPVRRRVPAMATAFAAIDRPEDRPFTLAWLISSVIVKSTLVVVWIWFAPETLGYLFVALFISGVGDALAEPVGLRFGRHEYRTRALGTSRTYVRTLEGSAVVFASGVVAVLIVHGVSMDARALAALAVFPVVGMLAEAWSPHTWDQPFIVGCCGVAAVGLSAV